LNGGCLLSGAPDSGIQALAIKSNTPISFAQHAATMFFPHFVGDARPRELRQLDKWRVRPT
jgi:hypothetical protein